MKDCFEVINWLTERPLFGVSSVAAKMDVSGEWWTNSQAEAGAAA